MKKKKSNQKKFKKEDIFGLKSYTDGAEMWKFITSELDPTNTPISFLNDKSFENLVAYHLLEAWLAYKKGQITKEQFMECICVGGVTDYLVAFNFCLYSEKADKWYSGIFMCGDETIKNRTKKHQDIFTELYLLYNFDKLTAKVLQFAHTYYNPSDETDVELLYMFDQHWDDFEFQPNKA